MNNNNFKELLEYFTQHQNHLIDLCSNVFTMREIGNKTHGDMAEIAVTAFINKFLSKQYTGIHVGKAMFRKKGREEDVLAIDNNTNEEIPISIKAYGEGYLQLSTDKEFTIFPMLESYAKNVITDKQEINAIMNIINSQLDLNVLLFIYNEDKHTCNVMIYDFDSIKLRVSKIEKILPQGARKYPIYKFLDINDNYLFEVRYGGKNANALQRGIWTNTKYAQSYFISATHGEIEYQIRTDLIDLISYLMIATNDEIIKLKGGIV